MHEATDIDPLVRMAVGHYQFEAIHPFTDGNGRTGRVLNSLFFISENLLSLPILYLSRYIPAQGRRVTGCCVRGYLTRVLGGVDHLHAQGR